MKFTVSADQIKEMATRAPFVSVVIPIRQEEKYIAASIDAVLGQEFDGSCEVLVVDGMSTDRTREIVRAIAARDPRVRLLDNPGQIVPTAMNVGIRAARGNIVVRIDGHCRIPRDYIAAVLQAFRESGAECVGGAMVAEGEGFWGKVIAGATSSSFGVGGVRFHGHGQSRYMDTVYLGAYPKQVLLDVGLYDEEFVRNQDDELNCRLRSQGGRVYFTSRIWAAYTCRSTLRALASQYFQYGWWKVRLYRKHPQMMRVRHMFPSAFLLALTLPLLTVGWFGWRVMLLPAGILALHATFGVVSGIAEGADAKNLAAGVLAFLVLHLSYGAGFVSAFVTAAFKGSAVRRLFDVVLCGAAILALSPLLLAIAVAVRLESRGPVLFRQLRVGLNEAPFRIIKFRTMVVDAERLGPTISGSKDPRVTRVGAVLRATKMDELPQLWNVLTGEMTLVGPRAEVPNMIKHYTLEERDTLKVKPGLTGPGQIYFTTDQAGELDGVVDVEAHYVSHQLHPKLALDLAYLRRRSLWTDLVVIVKTMGLLLRPFGV